MKALLKLSLILEILIQCNSGPSWAIYDSEENSNKSSKEMDTYNIPSEIKFISKDLRISIRKCGEYVAYIPFREQRRKYNEIYKTESSIESSPVEYSYMAAVGSLTTRGRFILHCAGALISPNFVLTSFTCYILPNKKLKNVSPSIVRLGTANIMFQDKPAIDIKILRIIKHPEQKGIYNNLALVELVNAVKFSKYIMPVCLSTAKKVVDRPESVTGWFFKNKINQRKPLNHILQSGNITDNLTNCLSNVNSRKTLNAQMFCINNIKIDGIASCPNKSGGTVQVNLHGSKKEGSFYKLMSIISSPTSSAPVRSCSSNTVVLIAIEPYIDWIERIVWPKYSNELFYPMG